MAMMQRFLTSLVFCEAPPLDGYGTSVLSAGGIKQLLVSGCETKPGSLKTDAEEQQGISLSGRSTTQQRRARFDLAFDGLNCFDTVVMH